VIPGYFEETHFSDNVIWIEILANYYGFPARTPGRGGSTTLTPEPNGNDWAWGGSEAAAGSVQPPGVTEPIPNLLLEVSQYLESNVPQPEILYSIWSGADNLLISGQFTPAAAQAAVDAVITAMKELEQAGAKHFLIFNMPQLADTPASLIGGLTVAKAASIYSTAYNTALKKALRKLARGTHFKADIYFVDVFKELVLVVNTVQNNQTYTPNFFVPGNVVAINDVTDIGFFFFEAYGTFPTNYLFWDDVHPTTQGHQVVAGLVIQSLQKGPLYK
jgi:phospholipase/lecithinase/hemolysin